jgi:hypothetical protein
LAPSTWAPNALTAFNQSSYSWEPFLRVGLSRCFIPGSPPPLASVLHSCARKEVPTLQDLTKPRWASSALITIDLQRDTLDGQPLRSREHRRCFSRLRAICDAFRSAGAPVIHVVRLYRSDGCNAELARSGAPCHGVLDRRCSTGTLTAWN